jgi:2',3'-cyclic-nucleotide 2'-phosphodiesterase (5'-nucleotidase family)
MKKFSIWAMLIIAFVSFSCVNTPQTVKAPSVPEIGSVDKNSVELLPSGKAKVVDILSFNDFHAALEEEPKGKSPGIGKLATVILEAKKANPNTLLLSGGDNFQGSALSSITKGKVVAEFFKLAGVNASAVGNHELDWGLDNFSSWESEGGFDFLAANIREKSSGKIPAWATPYKFVKVGGHLIAIIGLMTQETLTTVKADYVAPYEILNPGAVTVALIPEIEAYKPEIIIALTHIPSIADKNDPSKALAMPAYNELDALCGARGLNAVISGHSHNPVAGYNKGIPVVQAYYNGRDLAKLSITFDKDGGFKIVPSVNEFYKTKDALAEYAPAKAIFTANMEKYGKALNDKVATLNGNLSHDSGKNVTPMGYWVCETLRTRYKLDAYVQNGGGLRKGFVSGDLLVKDFWDLMPFDNYTVVFEVSGADLKKIIDHGIDSVGFGNGQFSGIKVAYDPAAAYEAKVVSMTLADGTPIEDAKLYKVGTNDFQFTGGDKYVIKPYAKNVRETFEPVREVLLEEAKKAGVINAPSYEVLVNK